MTKEFDKASFELIRHQLGSINLADIKKEKERGEMSEAETKEYNAAISAVFV